MENTIRQPGLEVTTPPHDDRYYSDLEVPVGSGPETVKYDYRVNAPQVMDPPAPKSGLGMQLRRKRVIVAIILTVVAFVVGVAVGVTVGRKNNTSAVGGTASSDTGASKSKTSSGSAPRTSKAPARIPIPSDAPLAAVASGKIFFQTDSGDLVLSTLSTKSEEIIKPSVPAKNGTSLAAIEWNSGNEIRLFYLSPTNIIQEYAYSNGKWSDGPLASSAFTAFSASQLATCLFAANNQIRLYYQLANTTLQEANYDIGGSSNKWSLIPSGYLPNAKLGSGFSVINFAKNQLRMYFQAESFLIREMIWPRRDVIHGDNNQTWIGAASFGASETGMQQQKAKGLTAISAVRWEGTNAQQHVLYQSQANSLVDMHWGDIDRQWIEYPLAKGAKDPVGGAKVATTIDGGDVTLYYRADDGLRHMWWNVNSGWNMDDTDPLIPGS